MKNTMARRACIMVIYRDIQSTGPFIECNKCGWQIYDNDYPIADVMNWLIYCPHCGKHIKDIVEYNNIRKYVLQYKKHKT